jgi:hypothetical protein
LATLFAEMVDQLLEVVGLVLGADENSIADRGYD